jgi:hypothetical protein
LRGGGTIDPEYEAMLKSNTAVQKGAPVGDLEVDELSEQLPWPEGAESKKQSFVSYQKEYKQAQSDLRVRHA